jgi:hypothetical protein
MRLSKTAMIALPLAALALSGCGGGDDGGGTTALTLPTTEATVPSKAELISQGDAICGEVNAAAGAAETISSPGGETERAVRISHLYIGMVESIEGLGAPDGDAEYPALIAAAEALAKAEGEAKLAAERGESGTLDEAKASASTTLEEFQSAAGEYGFEECSEGPSAPTAAGSTGSTAEVEAEGGVEAAPEELEEEAPAEEAAPEEVAPETGGAGGGVEEAAPEEGGGSSGGSSGGVGPG